MNIQSLGSPTNQKLDDRTVGADASSAAASAAGAKPAATQAGASAKTDPSRGEVDAAVKKLNDSIAVSSQTLEFSVDDDSKQIVVKLIDQSTKEVLRQIPSAEALEMAKSIDKMQGRLLHQTA